MQIREGILDVVDKLYSPVSSLPWQRKDGQRPFIHSLNYHIRARKLNTMSAVPGTYQLQIDSPAQPPINARLLHEWTIHIRFKKFELGRSYSILVHLGEMYVGSVSAFTSSAAQKCGRCRNNWDIELEGFIHLDEVLKLSSVPRLSTDMVQPFLAEHLRVEVKGRKVRPSLGWGSLACIQPVLYSPMALSPTLSMTCLRSRLHHSRKQYI